MAVLDFGTAALVFGGGGLVLAHLARKIAHWPRRLFVGILVSAMTNAMADMLVRAASQRRFPVPLYRALLVVQTMVAPLPFLLVFAYILYCCGENARKSVLMRVLCVLSVAMAVSVGLWQMTGEISVTPDYALPMGQWPVPLFFFSATLSALTLIALFRKWKKLTNAQRVIFLACFFTSSSTVIILVKFLLAYDLIRRYLAQQEESAQQRTRVAVAQMRPHFIIIPCSVSTTSARRTQKRLSV